MSVEVGVVVALAAGVTTFFFLVWADAVMVENARAMRSRCFIFMGAIKYANMANVMKSFCEVYVTGS